MKRSPLPKALLIFNRLNRTQTHAAGIVASVILADVTSFK